MKRITKNIHGHYLMRFNGLPEASIFLNSVARDFGVSVCLQREKHARNKRAQLRISLSHGHYHLFAGNNSRKNTAIPNACL